MWHLAWTCFGVLRAVLTPPLSPALPKGFVNVLSRHTTTAIAINEHEQRLLDDIRQERRQDQHAAAPVSCRAAA